MRKINLKLLTVIYFLIVTILYGESNKDLHREYVDTLYYYHPSEQVKAGAVLEFDVVAYGGTVAGVAAAVQSAREGKSAILISSYKTVGGMTSGGLTATDLGSKETIGGMAAEFYTKIGKWTDFSAKEAEEIFKEMLEKSGVVVLKEKFLKSVTMLDGKIISIELESGEILKGKVFIDSTYEGDLLAAANVSYYVGREPAKTYEESLGGQWQKVSWERVYQFCGLPISPYRLEGDKNSGLLPEISRDTPGKFGEGDYRVQAYNFRMLLTKNKDAKVDFPKPAGYNRERFALLERFLNFEPSPKWVLNYTTKKMTDGPVQMREGDSNNAGSFSSDYVGGSHFWPDGTFEPVSFAELPPPKRGLPVSLNSLYKIREKIFQDHLNYQLGMMYFLSNDAKVPHDLRVRVQEFGLDRREFVETGFWPHHLYVREGRRMLSDYVVTQADCESKRMASDSVGLASYNMDSHFCQRVVVKENGLETVRNEGAFGMKVPKPYPISYRALVPRKSECVNLIVPVCLSSSHVAFGSIRMEPVFMILGQSAGHAAVLAINGSKAVQDVRYEDLKIKLLESKQILSSKIEN